MRRASIFLFVSVAALSSAAVENNNCESTENNDPPSWVNGGSVIILLVAVLLSFCGLGIVCEEYFVPALNVLCDEWNVPDDVAGATIMAMGNSAPEMFTTFISIFYTKSSLGVGTAIGSALFNHLMICGCSVIYSPNLVLHLNYKLLLRECSFYALSLMLVVWAIKGSFVGALLEIGATSEDCLSVHWMQSLFLCIVYGVYVLTCTYGGISTSPVSDWSTIDDNMRYSISSNESNGITLTPLLQTHEVDDYEEEEEAPADRSLYGTTSCYMYKQSRFYSRIRVISQLKWQKRYFVLDDTGLHYGLSPSDQHKYIDIFHATDVTYNNYTITIVLPQRKYRFKSTDEIALLAMYRLLKNKIDSYNSLTRQELSDAIAEARRLREVDRDDHETSASILSFPSGSGSRIIHVVLYPLKYLIYMTLPRVTADAPRLTALISVLWLGGLSLCMTIVSEISAKYFGISAAVMGLTLGAAGTSFPNLLSSVLVARQGCGDMAVANAFGSNIFCILAGLGLPWLMVSLQQGGEPYDQLKDDGIVVAVVFLLGLLAIFLLVLCVSQFVLRRWVGIAMVSLYVVYTVYAIWMDRNTS